MKYWQILKEEILGNLAVVYHRGDIDKLDRLLKKTYSNKAHIDFKDYNKALYTTTDMASQLNQVGNENNMKKIYGGYIIKLAFKGVSNCWFCNYEEYSKYNNCTIDNWKEQQFNKFNIPKPDMKILLGTSKKYTARHADISHYFEKRNLLGSRIKGIQYFGPNDGNCLLIYDWTTAVPLAVTNDEGTTWKKIDKGETKFSRGNFGKNDYIDTSKKISKFVVDSNGNVNCSNGKLTTLQGAPEKVGSFDCHDNQLTTLQGAPKETGGSFDCSGNKLTTLQGAPKEVGWHFDCNNNKLTTLQGAPEKVSGSFFCYSNKLTSLQGAPKEISGGFNCYINQLTTLQGAPEKVGGNFDCSGNKLTTLQGAPKKVSGYFKCHYNQLTSLQGAPKEVDGSFYCNDNQLATLQGAPEKVGGRFYCNGNKLTTLQGAPKEVDGYFNCGNNQLTKQEIVKYLKIAKISGGIFTDFGDFRNQREAIEKLSGQLKESRYFNY